MRRATVIWFSFAIASASMSFQTARASGPTLFGAHPGRSQSRSDSSELVTSPKPTNLNVVEQTTLHPLIVNGLATSAFPATVLVIADGGICTGTLIGCSTVLTAAHCFDPPVSPSNVLVFSQHDGFSFVSSIVVHPDFEFGQQSDLTVLRLSQPVSGIQPTPINVTSRVPYGTSATIVGFGKEGDPFQDTGIKRAGSVLTSPCSGVPDANHLCWDFLAPVGVPGADSNTCQGDSGGPLFVLSSGALTIAGVTSGGPNVSCLPPDHAYDADVFVDRAWIQATAGSDLGGSSCGGLSNAGSEGAPNSGALGFLTAASPEARYQVAVPSGTQLLRVTLNSENPPLGVDFHLYVKRNSPPSGADFDCASELPGGLEICEIANPPAGTYHLLAQRVSGSGRFQITAVPFTAAGSGGDCVPDVDTACLLDGKFKVEVDWTTVDSTGAAKIMYFGAERAESDESAFYWFFSPSNFEMGVKMVDACVPPFNKYWAFVSGLTSQAYTVTITKVSNPAEVQVYSNPLNNVPTTVADTSAFDCP